MKINKLFHWLYAFLMFLPVFFVAGRTLYTIFNENAKDSYYGETINEYEVSSISAFESNKDYYVNASDFINANTTSNLYVTYSSIEIIAGNDTSYDSNILSSNNGFIYYRENLNQTWFTFKSGTNTILYLPFSTTTYQLILKNATFNSSDLDYWKPFVKTITYNDYSYLDNAFEYSVNQLNESPLFAWATDSFLAEPITYVTDLFNMPSTSPVITLFSYWLTISLCWLVFDLVMYVPLLAHRWLDKGGIS